jgi:5-methylcytosine-specific restriction endonuclease McrA
MAIDYSVFDIPKVRKGDSRAEAKRAKRLSREDQERICREAVRKRDKGRCVVPGCKDASAHLHHIVYRSKGGKWRSENICSLCPSHHHMVHLGKITITGNADDELVITGSRKDLAFKL